MPRSARQHLVLAAEIAELARQEHVVPLAGNSFADLLAQCLPPRHCHFHVLQKPDIWQGKRYTS
jgi:hypothetical protein